jgi:hypothetical protein
MDKPILNELKTTLKNLENREYLHPTIKQLERRISNLIQKGCSKSEAYVTILDDLTEIMWESQKGVDIILVGNKISGEAREIVGLRRGVKLMTYQDLLENCRRRYQEYLDVLERK